MGLDSVIAKDIGITPAAVKNMRKMWGIQPAFSVVDTCAAEFRAQTPYYYSDYGVENEVDPSCDRKKVLVLGSGLNSHRAGHRVWTTAPCTASGR